MKAVVQCSRDQICRRQCCENADIATRAFFFLLVFLDLSINPSFLKAESGKHRTIESNTSSKYRIEVQSKVKPPCFFEKRAEGWHWYENSIAENSGAELQKRPVPSPTQVIEDQRKDLETKLHAAIVEPTSENLIAYIIAQRALMDQSQRFSEAWKRVVMTTPSLDETLVHPVDQNARHVYYDEQHKDLQKRIKKLAQEYGLFFFFRKNCPYCHGFASIVKQFSEKNGWSVLPISLDGGSLPEFPHAKRDNGIATRLQITHVPALIALHPKTGKLIPLAYGMVSESEIEERVTILTQALTVKGEIK